MDVQILGVRIGELPFDSLFQHAKSRLSFRSIRAVRALERQPSKLRVAGSNPAGVANLFKGLCAEPLPPFFFSNQLATGVAAYEYIYT
jgi:hypothetical protein